jgi:hypothetical protein
MFLKKTFACCFSEGEILEQATNNGGRKRYMFQNKHSSSHFINAFRFGWSGKTTTS